MQSKSKVRREAIDRLKRVRAIEHEHDSPWEGLSSPSDEMNLARQQSIDLEEVWRLTTWLSPNGFAIQALCRAEQATTYRKKLHEYRWAQCWLELRTKPLRTAIKMICTLGFRLLARSIARPSQATSYSRLAE